MKIEINSILQFSYPISNSKKEIWLSSFGLALTVYLFLVVFQPFGTYNYSNAYKYLLLVPYSIIAFTVFYSGNILLFRIFKRWKLIEEIFKLILFLSLCSVLNYWYSIHFINITEFSFQKLLYMGMFTFSMGAPICFIYLLSRYIYLKSKTFVNIEEELIIDDNPDYGTLTIVPSFGNSINLKKNNFIYAQSQGNYSEVYYLNELGLKKELIRIPLKTLEEQISDEFIIRCHRSFIINTNYILKKRGNAQGYKIKLKYSNDYFPVSRKYLDVLK